MTPINPQAIAALERYLPMVPLNASPGSSLLTGFS